MPFMSRAFMPFSQLVKRFRGVSQIFINLDQEGVTSDSFLIGKDSVKFVCRFIKVTILTKNDESTLMVESFHL